MRLPRGARDREEAGAMKLYRYLTGVDDNAFCKRVSAALNKGWELHGAPTLTFDSVKGRVICGQAIVKEVDGTWSEDVVLSDY
jgi:hypothetical protein